MASWDEIAQDISVRNPDVVRREKLAALSKLTGRPTIIYAADMFNNAKVAQAPGGFEAITVTLADIVGFNEVLKGVTGDVIDIVIESPGGSPEATESIVKLLRDRFKTIRFIIPSVAKSAATMLAMSGDEIILGQNAELGPTDPQMVMNGGTSPAHAILDQFDAARKELSKNAAVMPAWLPILQQYGPSLLAQCRNAIALTEQLVSTWLKSYMFSTLPKAKASQQARKVASYLAGKKHLSHGRSINLTELKRLGVKIQGAQEISEELDTAISDLGVAIRQTFIFTGALKFFENDKGTGMYNVMQLPVLLRPQAPGTPTSQMP